MLMFQISVEGLVKCLDKQMMGHLVECKLDEQYFRLLLTGLRLLHALYDFASQHAHVEEVSDFSFQFININYPYFLLYSI